MYFRAGMNVRFSPVDIPTASSFAGRRHDPHDPDRADMAAERSGRCGFLESLCQHQRVETVLLSAFLKIAMVSSNRRHSLAPVRILDLADAFHHLFEPVSGNALLS